MPASPLLTRRRILLGFVALVLAVATVVTVVALRSDADPAAGATTSASPTASSSAAGEGEPDADGSSAGGESGGDESEPAPSGGDPGDGEVGTETDKPAESKPRETLEPRPFDAEATPEPGVTVQVPSVEKVTGEANVPGEVGGPALRFTVELTNGTGKTLDLRTVVVNAYYGPDRTPAAPLLKPGGKAFEAEAGVDDLARGAFVFNIPTEFQDDVELEVDPGVGAAIVIFTGA
jgi:hypothetical protein